jgi:uncharacterized protein YlxW (UPF0749 family)
MTVRAPRIVLVVAMALVGVVVAVGANTFQQARQPQPERTTGLPELVERMEDERADLEETLAGLRERIAEIEALAAEEAGLAESFGRELDEVRAVAGLTGLAGPGVRVMLADAESVPPGQDPGACLIHDYDLVSVVNVLFAAGAEAVAVNDERIVTNTAVRCAGNTILVNGRRLGNPYEIRAVGDPEDLAEALTTAESVAALFSTYPTVYGLGTSIERRDEVDVPPYRGSLRTEYAVAVEEGR